MRSEREGSSVSPSKSADIARARAQELTLKEEAETLTSIGEGGDSALAARKSPPGGAAASPLAASTLECRRAPYRCRRWSLCPASPLLLHPRAPTSRCPTFPRIHHLRVFKDRRGRQEGWKGRVVKRGPFLDDPLFDNPLDDPLSPAIR